MLMDIKGGYLQLGDYSDVPDTQRIHSYGKQNFPKQTILGSSWIGLVKVVKLLHNSVLP